MSHQYQLEVHGTESIVHGHGTWNYTQRGITGWMTLDDTGLCMVVGDIPCQFAKFYILPFADASPRLLALPNEPKNGIHTGHSLLISPSPNYFEKWKISRKDAQRAAEREDISRLVALIDDAEIPMMGYRQYKEVVQDGIETKLTIRQ